MAQERIAGKIAAWVFLSLFLTPAAGGAQTPPSGWSDLELEQKIILAPLADEWDSLPPFRQKQWQGVAARFPALNPGEQRRLQGQMQKWRKLTPDEQQTARDSFKTASRLPADKRQKLKQKWEQYSSLPEEEKEKLKNQGAGKTEHLKFILPPAVVPGNFPQEARTPFKGKRGRPTGRPRKAQ